MNRRELVRNILTPEEEERMRRETPRPRRDSDEDLADVIEATLRTHGRGREVPVVVQPVLAGLRRRSTS